MNNAVKPKVCVVTSWFPTKNRPNLAPFVFNFAKNLGKCGVEVSVIIPNTDNGESITKLEFMTVYRVPKKLSMLSMLGLVKTITPDIIHVHAPNSFSSNAIVVAKLKGIPIVATVHRGEIDRASNVVRVFRKFALARFDKIIAVSVFTRSLALKAGARADYTSVIYNSCDEMIFSPSDKFAARQKLNLSSKKIFLYVGNLIKIKGVYTLIEACKILSSTNKDFLLLVIGDGKERGKLESLVKSYDLDKNVQFLGWLPQNILPHYYNASDFFVLPSVIEGHSVALLEAMASGLPVIASKVGGNMETIVDGENGFLFETGDPRNLAENLLRLLTNDVLRVQMSQNSLSIYGKKFSTKIQMENYLKIYESLVKSKLMI